MNRAVATLSLAALVALVGCGEKTIPLPTPVPVSGKVFLADGSPAKDVGIHFNPVEAHAPAYAVVGEDGSFTLKTYENKTGACAGKYRVTFQAAGQGSPLFVKSEQAIKAIPQKYRQDDSPLEAVVPSGGKTDFEFKLDAR